MRIDRFLSKNRILELKSRELPSALEELLAAALPAGTEKEKRAEILEKLLGREMQMQRRVGNWASLHYEITPSVPSTVIAVGRFPAVAAQPAGTPGAANPAGTSPGAETVPAKRPPACGLRVVFLVLFPKRVRNSPAVLSELEREMEDEDRDAIAAAPDLKALRRVVLQRFRGAAKFALRSDTRWNRRFAATAVRLAVASECQVLLFFADTFSKLYPWDSQKEKRLRVVFVSEKTTDFLMESGEKYDVLNVSSFGSYRMSQLRAALFVGLMRGVILPTDRICCLGGIDGSEKLDSLVVLEAAQEFPSLMVKKAGSLVPARVRPVVLERAIAIATALAVEGREGKPVGSMFVIGEVEKIKPYVQQLILNPFAGVRAEDRLLTDSSMTETVKELALIDGAFVIDGDGAIVSAGSMLTAAGETELPVALPGGLGTRHAAAAAISSIVDCAAVCISSSGQVTLFRHGEPIVLLERSTTRTL